MPNTREKLIELLKNNREHYLATYTTEHHKSYEEYTADHLIANGVTFATDNNVSGKWIPVTERLPEKDGKYLVFERSGSRTVTSVLRFAKDARKVDRYDFRGRWKNAWYEYDSEWGHYTVDSVTHWMPLPEPPEGE